MGGFNKSTPTSGIIASKENLEPGRTEPPQQGMALRWTEEAEMWSCYGKNYIPGASSTVRRDLKCIELFPEE